MSGSSNHNNDGSGGRRPPPAWDQNDPAFDLDPMDRGHGDQSRASDGSRRYDPAHDPRYAPRPGVSPPQPRLPQPSNPRLSLNTDWQDAPVSRRVPQLSPPEPTRPVAPQGYPQQNYGPPPGANLPRAPYEAGRYAPIEPLPSR
ncbi:MAG: hypothetical protein RL291_1641, partial [Pseudomonadota bacterium]